MSAACRSAEEAASALMLQLAQAEADTAAAVVKQQQAQASGEGGIEVASSIVHHPSPPQTWLCLLRVCVCACVLTRFPLFPWCWWVLYRW